VRTTNGSGMAAVVFGVAHGPPTDWRELVQVHDDRAIFQSSPDELPVIDIHSL
jgi:hypothetical protein